jgi:hypothetical protein
MMLARKGAFLDMAHTAQSPQSDQSASYGATRFNALRHGVLSRYTVLTWEDEAEYQDLLDALVAEHAPVGPTEEHLVEELAGILWRKRRLRMAEAAAHHRGLDDATRANGHTARAALVHVGDTWHLDPVAHAVCATDGDTEADLAGLETDEAMAVKALEVLEADEPGSYERAIAALSDDTRRHWEDACARDAEDIDLYEDHSDFCDVAGREPYTTDAASLRHYLTADVLPSCRRRRRDLEHRPLIRAQALGQSLDPDALGKLARYEVHLDRKLERTLAMLLRLRDLRPRTVES